MKNIEIKEFYLERKHCLSTYLKKKNFRSPCMYCGHYMFRKRAHTLVIVTFYEFVCKQHKTVTVNKINEKNKSFFFIYNFFYLFFSLHKFLFIYHILLTFYFFTYYFLVSVLIFLLLMFHYIILYIKITYNKIVKKINVTIIKL